MNPLAFLSLALAASAAFPQTAPKPTPPSPVTTQMPFGIAISAVTWSGSKPLPPLQSFAHAVTSDGKWLFLTGLTSGLHGFSTIGQLPPPSQNFPQKSLNENIFVVDPRAQQVWSQPLPSAFLYTLAVVAPQATQVGDHLYIVGGYGYTSDNLSMTTQAYFTVLDVDETAAAVIAAKPIGTHIRQAKPDEYLRVTGGDLAFLNNRFLLIFGHNFQGFYTPQSNGDYTYQVRTFAMQDNGTTVTLSDPKTYGSVQANPDFRRRDLNAVPAIRPNGALGFTVLGGVFTTENGAWRTPVYIDSLPSGGLQVADDTTGFLQYMNQYNSATLPVYSAKNKLMSEVLFGGIGEVYYHPALGFRIDQGIPFVDEVTAVNRSSAGASQQVLFLDGGSVFQPLRLPALLGTGAHFIPDPAAASAFKSGILNVDQLSASTTVGYIFGGIVSDRPNNGKSTASNQILRVTVSPQPANAIVVNVNP